MTTSTNTKQCTSISLGGFHYNARMDLGNEPMFNLTAAGKALVDQAAKNGMEVRKDPRVNEWLKLKKTQTRFLNTGKTVIKVGRYGSTWGTKRAFLDFARWVSDDVGDFAMDLLDAMTNTADDAELAAAKMRVAGYEADLMRIFKMKKHGEEKEARARALRLGRGIKFGRKEEGWSAYSQDAEKAARELMLKGTH